MALYPTSQVIVHMKKGHITAKVGNKVMLALKSSCHVKEHADHSERIAASVSTGSYKAFVSDLIAEYKSTGRRPTMMFITGIAEKYVDGR